MSEGKKYDDQKPPIELIPYEALDEIAKVLAFGAKKYDAFNWTKGIEYRRLIGAAQRHLGAFNSGEDKDPESGLSHLAHVGCCIAFLLWHEKHRPDLDNRGFKATAKKEPQFADGSELFELRMHGLYETRTGKKYRIIDRMDDGTFLGRDGLTGDEKWFYHNGAHAFGISDYWLVKEVVDVS